MPPKRVFSETEVFSIVEMYRNGKTIDELSRIFSYERHQMSKFLKKNGVDVEEYRNSRDLSGQRFGRLIAVEWTGRSGRGGRIWLCRCDCGNTTFSSVSALCVNSKRSCGCLAKEARDTYRKIYADARKLPKGESKFRGVWNEYRVSARRRKIEWHMSMDEFREIVSLPCAYCGLEPTNTRETKGYNGEFIFSGVDRVDNSIGYFSENCVPCCTTCNVAKRVMNVNEFLQWIERVYNHSVKDRK